MFNLRVAVPPRLRTQVAETLRNAIVLGELAPGERLIERVLCERMGVSRTSLREAMRELENEGLLTNLPNRGLIVSVVDPKIAQEIFDVREALEALICRLFCERATDEHVELCRTVNVELMAAYEAGAPRELIAAKNRLYDVLIAGADNAEAERMLRSIHMRASQLRIISLSHADRRKASQEEIQLLVDSLVSRRGKDAERLARKHVQQAAKFAMSTIKHTDGLDLSNRPLRRE